jgi:hypothetical protein
MSPKTPECSGLDYEENGWKVSEPINRMILKKQS